MRKLIATVFNYSLNGLLADEGTVNYQFCMGLPADPADVEQSLDFLRSADAHIMGRTAYEGMAANLPGALRPPRRRHPERRAHGRLLPDHEDGRLGEDRHRRW